MIGGLALGVSIATLLLALRPSAPADEALRRLRIARGELHDSLRSRLGATALFRAWRPIDAETLRLAGLPGLATVDVALAKVGLAAAASVAGVVVGVPPLFLGIIAFAGFVAPSEWVRRRGAARLRARRDALLPFAERAMALSNAGMTFEQAIAQLAEAEGALGAVLREARGRAELGLSVFDALADVAEREGVPELRDLARDLARSRRGGRPLQPVLAERREVLRLARRAERLDAVSRVDGALSLVLVLAYLPALLLLVVVPLFLGLLRSLGT